MCHAVTDWTAPALELTELCAAERLKSKYSAAEEFIGTYCVEGQMRPGFGRSGKAGFYCDLRNCCSVSCPSGCPPSFLLSVKFVTADANCTFVGQSFHSVAAPRCTRRRVLQQSHTAPFAELHQAYLWPPLTVSMPSGKKRGGVGVGGGQNSPVCD